MQDPAIRGNSATTKGMLLVLGAACLWGTTGTSQALAPENSSPLAIGAMRLVIGGITLTLVSLLNGGLRKWDFNIPLILLTGFFVALYQVSFFSGIKLTGVAAGTIVGIGSSPVFAGLLELLVSKKPPGRRWYFSTLLAITGCAVLIVNGSTIHINTLGILLSMLAGLAYSSYAFTIKLLIVNRDAEEITSLVFLTGAALLSPILLTHDLSWLSEINGWLLMLHLGVLATALSYYLFARGIEYIPVSSAVTLSLAEPLTATVLGVFVVGEQLSYIAWCGLFLILSGIIILVFPIRLFRRGVLH